ncbi:MAG: hypothetical protein RIQ89_2270 [Bacteroidota bacterium]|jgi:hypothetical protein
MSNFSNSIINKLSQTIKVKIKMKKSIILAFAALTEIFTITSCKKKEGCTNPISISYDESAEVDDGSCRLAGLGGSTTIVAYPRHHGKDTRPYKAFIKFNIQDFPGADPTSYDLELIADTTENHIEVRNLKPGKYFIYMTAFDTTIAAGVVGGIPYTLLQEGGEVNLTIPVTE